jgi:hypothetical protein
LIKGSSYGSIASIPNAGNRPPNSIAGAIALWKNPQNMAMKKNTSDIINNTKPTNIPL